VNYKDIVRESFSVKEGEALRCKIGPTFYQKIMLHFKGLAEVINKLIFNNLHNPPPTKYVDTIINPLYSKQLLNLV
jgi:hypothetical protein